MKPGFLNHLEPAGLEVGTRLRAASPLAPRALIQLPRGRVGTSLWIEGNCEGFLVSF